MTSSGTPAPAPWASAPARGGAGWAFLSMLRRDLFVTSAELPVFIAQAIIQPVFMAFVFGKVLTDLGFARPGFAQRLLPGLVALRWPGRQEGR
jgi:ABC-2 type transport system permease protein